MALYLDDLASALGLSDIMNDQLSIRIASASIIITIFFGFILLLSKIVSKQISKGDTVLILGGIGSGKTSLYYQLFTGKFRETHTSMKENIGTPKLNQTDGPKIPSYRYVDFPGHKSQRTRLSTYFSQTRAIVFLIDVGDNENYRSTGQYLFSLMTDAILYKKKVPLLIAFNKTDKETDPDNGDWLSCKKKLLEDLEKCRTGALGGISSLGDTDDLSSVELGIPGKKFQFAHSPLPIKFGSVATKISKISPILEFLAQS